MIDENTTIDQGTTRQHELERRVSTLEDEVKGEKIVSRHILQETRRSSDDLAAMKAQLMHLTGDMILANTALNSHGVRLNVLTQDVREIRTEMGKMRKEMDEMRTEMGELRTEMGEIRAEVGGIRTEMGELRTEMGGIRTEMNHRFDAVERSIAVILAAVAPHAP